MHNIGHAAKRLGKSLGLKDIAPDEVRRAIHPSRWRGSVQVIEDLHIAALRERPYKVDANKAAPTRNQRLLVSAHKKILMSCAPW